MQSNSDLYANETRGTRYVGSTRLRASTRLEGLTMTMTMTVMAVWRFGDQPLSRKISVEARFETLEEV